MAWGSCLSIKELGVALHRAFSKQPEEKGFIDWPRLRRRGVLSETGALSLAAQPRRGVTGLLECFGWVNTHREGGALVAGIPALTEDHSNPVPPSKPVGHWSGLSHSTPADTFAVVRALTSPRQGHGIQ